MNRSLSQNAPMTALYDRLAAAGFPKAYVRKYALPEWWRDESALNPSGLAMARGFIARYLGLSLATLQDPNAPIECEYDEHSGAPKFKFHKNVQKNDAHWPACIAARAAELSLKGAPRPAHQIPKDGVSPREAILRSGVPWVGLEQLLDYCWNIGIPVLHLSHFPVGKKMDGMAASFGGRPAIVIAKNHKNSAWLAFILAHELGHIARGHLSNAPFIFDEKVKRDATEDEEVEANRFAVEVLTGHEERKYKSDLWLTAEQLAESAEATSHKHKVDPGVIAMNYAWHKSLIPVGQGALNILEPEADAVGLIRRKLQQRLEWQRLPKETAEYLRRICDLSEANDSEQDDGNGLRHE